MEDPSKFEVKVADEAFAALFMLSSAKTYYAIRNDIGLLELTPYLGKVYDPVYPAAMPPYECRVLYCGRYGIYYTVDEEAQTVFVFAIEDNKRNPETRFAVVPFPENNPTDEQ